MEIAYFLHESTSKRCFRYEIRSLLRRADARGSADIIYLCDAYRYFVGQAYSY